MSNSYPGGLLTAGADTGFSVAFDGTGDYLSTPSTTALQLSAATAFTIEAWVYPTSLPNTDHGIIGKRTGGTGEWQFFIKNDKTLHVYSTGGDYTSGTTISGLNQWIHCAVTWNLTTLRFFINGTLCSTTHNSISLGTPASSDVTIGASYAANELWYGYLSNVRVVKGTALYTSNFTPPTQLLTVPGTSLLACQSPTLIDKSTNNLTITAVGDAKVSDFTPFAGYKGFNPAIGAAAGGVWTLEQATSYQSNRTWPIYDPYFNQTTLMLHGNGLNNANNTSFIDSSSNNFAITRNGNTTQGTFTPYISAGWGNYVATTSQYLSMTSPLININDWTVEFWMWPQSYVNAQGVFGCSNGGGTQPKIAWQVDGTNIALYVYNGGFYTTLIYPYPPVNQWTYVSLSRSSATGQVYLYYNGVLVKTAIYPAQTGVTGGFQLFTNGEGGTSGFYGSLHDFRVSNTARYIGANYNVPTKPLEADAGTVLLTSQSNRFEDFSAIKNAITVNGLVSVLPFTPYVPAYITPTTYSAYFDGNGDSLTAPQGSAFQFPGDFTMECWVYANNSTGGSSYDGIFDTRSGNVNSSNAAGINYKPDGYLNMYVGGANTGSSTLLGAKKWVHIALVRNGSVVTMYQNGVSVASASTSANLSDGYFTIGGFVSDGYWNGIISNVRVVKGTAVYSTNFTPPSAPLTAISGTQILTCQSSTFIDNSSNNFTITANGNARPVQSPTPFPAYVDQSSYKAAYYPLTHGGSTFNGAAGDGLKFLNSSTQFGAAGDYTIELWFYPTGSLSEYNILVNFADGTGSDNPSAGLFYNSSYYLFWLNNGSGGGGLDVGGAYNIVPFQWNHIVLSRSSGTSRLFTNGVLRHSGFNTDSMNADKRFLYINTNRGLTDVSKGYTSGFRFINGTALYTKSFAPPLDPPTNIANTTVLVNSTNAGIVDSTAKHVVETIGTAKISTVQSKFGGSSMAFDGSSSSSLAVPFTRNLDLSTGAPDWTLECWGYVNNFTNSPYFFNKGGVAATYYTNYSFSMTGDTNSGTVYCTLGNNSGETSYTFGTCLVNRWYHFAATRKGNTIRTFLDGILVTTSSITTTMTDNGEGLFVGMLKNLTTNVLNGYVNDLRITKGYARYLTNFTPPTSLFQNQ